MRSPGQNYPTVARQIDLLGAGHGKTTGLGLVEKRAELGDRRIRHVAISAQGKQLLYELDLIPAPTLLDGVRTLAPNE